MVSIELGYQEYLMLIESLSEFKDTMLGALEIDVEAEGEELTDEDIDEINERIAFINAFIGSIENIDGVTH